MSVDFNDTVIYSDTAFNAFTKIRSAYDFERDGQDKEMSGLVLSSGKCNMHLPLTIHDAAALIVLFESFIEASNTNKLSLVEKNSIKAEVLA